jgi:protein-S-isoprenylcysteine O-methyltransferase Ste14
MDTYKIVGLGLVVVFYLSFFVKMLLQKAKGIKTNQLARGNKPKKTYLVEVLLKVITYLTAVVQLVSIILSEQLPIMITNSYLRIMGSVFSLLGLVLFILAMVTMKDSWRAGIDAHEKTKFVTTGIYKYSRNPAFLGFDLFYFGFVLLFSNGLIILFSVTAILFLHFQIMEEERFLPKLFGEEYLEYKKRTGRYFIKF